MKDRRSNIRTEQGQILIEAVMVLAAILLFITLTLKIFSEANREIHKLRLIERDNDVRSNLGFKI